MRIKLVLLAAGLSRRYGAENKLLVPWQGKPLYRWTLDALAQLAATHPADYALVVVTQYPEIAAHCAQAGIAHLHNPRAAEGITTSLHLGLGWGSREEATAFFVADQPGLTEGTILRFLQGWAGSGKGLGCVTHGGQPGNPCIFSSCYREALLALSGDRGGKAVLLRHPEDCWLCPVEDAAELTDVDTPLHLSGHESIRKKESV